MKAVVLKELGTAPVYEDYEDPKTTSGEELIMEVKAGALKNLDRLMASLGFYAGYKNLPVVVGTEAVGVLENGSRVYARGRGTFAEKAVVNKEDIVELPTGIDWAVAAAIPNAALGSYLPLKVKVNIKKGDVVLINGGTGITGKFAVQLARYYGASKIIVAGRVRGREEELSELGADEFVPTNDPEILSREIKKLNKDGEIDLVLDYLWGEPAEMIINSLVGEGGNSSEKPIKFINIGNVVSPNIDLNCNVIRSSKLEIIGSGLGSYSKGEFSYFYQNVLPEMFRLVADRKVNIDVHLENLQDIGFF